MITNYLADRFLAQLCGKTEDLAAYVGLSRTEPLPDGTNVSEPYATEYSRPVIGYTNSYSYGSEHYMGAIQNNEVTNNKLIYFPEARTEWGTCTHFCIFSAKTGGNLLAYGELKEPITPVANTVPLIRVGDLKLSITINTEATV